MGREDWDGARSASHAVSRLGLDGSGEGVRIALEVRGVIFSRRLGSSKGRLDVLGSGSSMGSRLGSNKGRLDVLGSGSSRSSRLGSSKGRGDEGGSGSSEVVSHEEDVIFPVSVLAQNKVHVVDPVSFLHDGAHERSNSLPLAAGYPDFVNGNKFLEGYSRVEFVCEDKSFSGKASSGNDMVDVLHSDE